MLPCNGPVQTRPPAWQPTRKRPRTRTCSHTHAHNRHTHTNTDERTFTQTRTHARTHGHTQSRKHAHTHTLDDSYILRLGLTVIGRPPPWAQANTPWSIGPRRPRAHRPGSAPAVATIGKGSPDAAAQGALFSPPARTSRPQPNKPTSIYTVQPRHTPANKMIARTPNPTRELILQRVLRIRTKTTLPKDPQPESDPKCCDFHTRTFGL
jgi:hypothetical protein